MRFRAIISRRGWGGGGDPCVDNLYLNRRTLRHVKWSAIPFRVRHAALGEIRCILRLLGRLHSPFPPLPHPSENGAPPVLLSASLLESIYPHLPNATTRIDSIRGCLCFSAALRGLPDKRVVSP